MGNCLSSPDYHSSELCNKAFPNGTNVYCYLVHYFSWHSVAFIVTNCFISITCVIILIVELTCYVLLETATILKEMVVCFACEAISWRKP
jgi:hypothetical protein